KGKSRLKPARKALTPGKKRTRKLSTLSFACDFRRDGVGPVAARSDAASAWRPGLWAALVRRRRKMRGSAFVPAAPLGPRRRVLFPLLGVVLLTGSAYAQSFLGTIRGTVTDPQGAAVAKATVLVTDEATGVPRTVETDAQGRYEAPNLRPGNYR